MIYYYINIYDKGMYYFFLSKKRVIIIHSVDWYLLIILLSLTINIFKPYNYEKQNYCNVIDYIIIWCDLL